jgi:predicted ribosome quality control (RQC) complex YloA/Tae2 family protein
MSAEPTVIVPARLAPAEGSAEQLSRIEEKTARIEEKFARQEAVFGRAQDALDRAADRVEQAAKSVDAVELANEVAALRARIDKTPQTATLVLAGLVTSIVTACVFVLLLKLFPGIIR